VTVEKLPYEAPALTEVGSVRALTAQGGGVHQTDVPFGTPPPIPGDPASAFS
jgi:hypothetical protein